MYYCDNAGEEGHIGIVHQVDAITTGMTKRKLMQAVHVIESVYDGEINYVTSERVFDNAWRTDRDGVLREWQIVRLKTK